MLHRAPGSQYSTPWSVRPERNRYGNTASSGMALRRSPLLHRCCCTATNWDTTDAFAATQRPAQRGSIRWRERGSTGPRWWLVLLLRLLRLPLLLRLYFLCS